MANELKVAITADSSSAMASLSQFSGVVKATSAQIEGSFGGMANAVQNFAAPLMKITALLGGGAIFKGSVDQAVTLGKEVNSLQRLFGGTAEQASVTRIAIKEVFGDVDGYESAATKLVKTLNKNESAIKSMGVQTRDSQGHFREMTELMPEVVGALSQYESGTDRDAAAQAIFGRSFADVLKYVAMTPEAMERARKHAHDFGLELDGQEKDTIKKYRSSVQLVSEAWEGLGVRVGVAVMPGLASMANMLSSNAPAAINATVGALRVAQGLLSNTAIQIGLGALALNTAIPLVVSLATKIPLVSTAMGMWRVQMALASAGGVTGFAAITGAARGTAAGLLGMINPWVLAGVAVTAVAAQLIWFSKASERAAEASKRSVAATEASTKSWRDNAREVAALEQEMSSSNTTHARKLQIQDRLTEVTAALVKIYPEFANQLKTEAGLNNSLTASINAKTKARVADLEMLLLQSRLQAKSYQDEIDQREQWNKHGKAQITPGNDLKNESVIKEISYNEKKLSEVKGLLATLKNTSNPDMYAELEGLKAKLEDDAGGKHWGGLGDGSKPTEQISQAELALRLEKSRIEAMRESTLVEQQAKAEAKANLELETERIRLNKEVAEKKLPIKAAQAEYDALKVVNGQKLSNIQTEYNDKRTALEDQLQGQLTAAEEGGLAKRLEAIRKNFAKIREENKKLGDTGVSEDAIQRAQDAQEAQAKIDQTKADLETLKNELSELAQISGGKLSAQATNEVLTRYRKTGKGGAADQYSKENHLGDGANAGVMAGLNEKLAEQEQPWARWKNITLQNVNAVQSGMSKLFSRLVLEGGSATDKVKSFFAGLGETAVQSLADIAAQNLVTWGIQKAQEIWAIGAAGESATAAGAQAAGDIVAADAAETRAAAETWASYAWIPFVGQGLAIAQNAAMEIDIASVTAFAHGGIVDRPTWGVVGEAGERELVAPESSFLDWASQVQNAHYSLGANIGRQQAQAANLQDMASSYTSSAARAASNRSLSPASPNGGYSNGGDVHFHLAPGAVVDTSGRGKQQLARIATDAMQHADSRNSYRINADRRVLGRS